MSEENKALMRRFYQEVVNGGNLDLIDQFVAPDFVEHEVFPGLSADREGMKRFFVMMRSAFPDLRMDVDDLIAEGDKVVSRVTMRGTHKGEFMGIGPTGRTIVVPTVDIVCIAGGKAVEHWGVTDTAAMMEQLGAAAVPGS